MDAIVSSNKPVSLRASLTYEPQVLKFGTSGRRGEVIHLTQLEIYINAMAELEYLLGVPACDGGIVRGDEFYFAADLRPSSTRFDMALGGRGEIAQAIVCAIRDSGLKPINLGRIPTPALAYYALSHGKGSIMITGSHIPFERNGYKVNTSKGELLKKDEAPINALVEKVRARLYEQSFSESIFNEKGMFKKGHQVLPRKRDDGRLSYMQRYVDFFSGKNLRGKRLVVYEHSAVGREILVEVLKTFGAEVIPAGKSSSFVPIDTENIDATQLAKMRHLVVEATRVHGPVDALVSTDGDSDRPLFIGVNYEPGMDLVDGCHVRFFGGDLLGMIVAEYLGVDAVVVPISCNDALDMGPLRDVLEPKTRIGSPHVIGGMEKACAKGSRRVCGWEANGGFLTGSDIEHDGKVLKALPTRDAMLPILCVLFASIEHKVSVSELFGELPKRFSKAALLKNFPRAASLKMIAHFSPRDERVKEIQFTTNRVDPRNEDGKLLSVSEDDTKALNSLREGLAKFFKVSEGFGSIVKLNYVDGIRIYFSNGDVAHVRPSGNADELRIYAVADSQMRADDIVAMGISEPDGLLRSLAKVVMV